MKLSRLSAALLAAAATMTAPIAISAPAIFTNGAVSMGVNDDGSLGGGAGTGLALAGLGDAITPGCLCEGWGAAANGVGNYTYAGGGSAFGISTATLAAGVSTVTMANGLEVTHTYSNVGGGVLFRVDVSIKNTSGALATDIRYARTLDWDVPPAHFSDDRTTIFVPGGAPAGKVLHTSFDPFAEPDPMVTRGSIVGSPGANTNGTDIPGDLGAYFILTFGDLADGASTTFTTYIGAADTTAGLLAAFGSVGVEAYSYSFDTDPGTAGDVKNEPTFGWGFAGLDLPPISRVPEPGVLALLGLGLAAVGVSRRRKTA